MDSMALTSGVNCLIFNQSIIPSIISPIAITTISRVWGGCDVGTPYLYPKGQRDCFW
ncbi:hypothetical protein HanRHA438_Chr14g0668071 [Helianthus annuus]|nr:hypothetical protein HanRHA438_Chr14g0668071 [Helianthus annuus]